MPLRNDRNRTASYQTTRAVVQRCTEGCTPRHFVSAESAQQVNDEATYSRVEGY